MSELLGEARILIRPDTTKFRAELEAQLAAASKPLTIPVVAGAATGAGFAAVAGFSTAQKDAAVSALGLADATKVENAALARGAVLLQANAVASEELAGVQAVTAARTRTLVASQAAQARQMGQLERGAAATGLSMFGLRGATLAASGAFLAGAASITVISKSVAAASDRTEQLNKSVEVFVGTAPKVRAWSESTATSMGLSQTAALQASATYGQLFRTLGVGPAKAAVLSESLVKLASDLASFNNVTPERALAAIQSGLVGQARPLRQLGVFLTAARVQQEALAESGKKTASSLTQQDTILARYNLILRDASLASGDFQRTQGRLANQGRILRAQITNLAADIGSTLTPVIEDLIVDLNFAVTGMTKVVTEAGRLAQVRIPPIRIHFIGDFNIGGHKGETLGDVLKKALFLGPTVTADVIRSFRGAGQEANVFDEIARNVGVTITALANQFANLGSAISKVTARDLAGLEVGLLKIQTGLAPGGRPGQEANLRKQIEDDKKLVELTKSGTAARKKALQELLADQQALQSLLDQDAADAQQAAQDAKAAAQKAQADRDARDQAFLDMLGGKQGKLENRLLVAQGTQSLADDIRVEKLLLRFFNESIRRIRRVVQNAKLRAQAIAQLTTEIIQTQNEIKRLTQQQAEQQTNTQQQILQINIQIAQTTGNVAAEKRADEAYIKFLERQIKKAKGDRLRIKQLQLELAQTKADLKKLTQQAKSNATAQAEFTFLQTQTGFVSNLLGNLIPLGSTGGLVGGGGRPTTPSNVRQSLTTAQTQAQATRTPGVTSGQGETQIYWLKQIAIYLKRLNEGRDHPEAHHQRKVGAAAYDYGYQGPGM